MSIPSTLPVADTSDMAGLHNVFREAMSAAPGSVSTVLHGHHEVEDELMTPKLLERPPEHAATINRDSATESLAVPDAVLTPHLDEEAATIVSLRRPAGTSPNGARCPSTACARSPVTSSG